MGKFLTSPAAIKQFSKGLYKVLSNELYKDDDGFIYLVPRGFQTDNFTWINSSKWDIRCSHFHDVGCKYHQVLKLKWYVTEDYLRKHRLLRVHNSEIICEDIPVTLLQIENVSGHWINNMFYRLLKSADCPPTPKYIQLLYRAGVAFNINWFKTGKEKIYFKNLYEE